MLTQSQVFDTLRDLLDPDIGINVVDLGLVEKVETEGNRIAIGLIMTTPACPQTGYLQDEASRLLRMAAPGSQVDVAILQAPFWSPDRLSDSARATLGWPG